jgi:solute carrier family 35 protein E3
MAIAVNLCSAGLIGKTSAVTYQVVGHLKTCLVLIGGFIFVPTSNFTTKELLKNVFGISIAMVGVIAYSWFNMQDSQPKQEKKELKIEGISKN